MMILVLEIYFFLIHFHSETSVLAHTCTASCYWCLDKTESRLNPMRLLRQNKFLEGRGMSENTSLPWYFIGWALESEYRSKPLQPHIDCCRREDENSSFDGAKNAINSTIKCWDYYSYHCNILLQKTRVLCSCVFQFAQNYRCLLFS